MKNTLRFAPFLVVLWLSSAYAEEQNQACEECLEAQKEAAISWENRDREDFDVDFNLGWQLDRFTASNLANALNPEDSSDNEQSALLDIRVNWHIADTFGDWWLYGNTARTIRGTEVICKDNEKFIGCSKFDGTFGIGDIPGADVAFSILRNAESLEAHVGIRHEFLPIPLENDIAPGSFYWSYQAGFASVEDTDDLAKINQFALGIVVTGKRFRNSFIEYGRGKNELFPSASDDRNVVRVHLEYMFTKNVIGFLETEVDYDNATGADSVRSKIGIEIPIGVIFSGDTTL